MSTTERDDLRHIVAIQKREVQRIRLAWRACDEAHRSLDEHFMRELKRLEAFQLRLARVEGSYKVIPEGVSRREARRVKIKERAIVELASSLTRTDLLALIAKLGELEGTEEGEDAGREE